MVKMGELEVSTAPGDVLVALGLGSCIGLALVDRSRAAAGLAHIMLPDDGNAPVGPAKYARSAVPALIDELSKVGARRESLEAVLVGGAQMFSFDGKDPALELGPRNEAATRAALEEAGIPVRAAATRGNTGRTIRVSVDSGVVTVKEAGGHEVELLPARTADTSEARA